MLSSDSALLSFFCARSTKKKQRARVKAAPRLLRAASPGLWVVGCGLLGFLSDVLCLFSARTKGGRKKGERRKENKHQKATNETQRKEGGEDKTKMHKPETRPAFVAPSLFSVRATFPPSLLVRWYVLGRSAFLTSRLASAEVHMAHSPRGDRPRESTSKGHFFDPEKH